MLRSGEQQCFATLASEARGSVVAHVEVLDDMLGAVQLTDSECDESLRPRVIMRRA